MPFTNREQMGFGVPLQESAEAAALLDMDTVSLNYSPARVI